MKMEKMLLDKLEAAQQAIDNKIKENEQYFILFKKWKMKDYAKNNRETFK